MGSILLASGGVKLIKEIFPNAKIISLTMTRNYEVVNSLGCYDEIKTIEVDKGLIRFFLDIFKLWIYLIREKMDMVIDLEFFTRISAIISYLSGAPIRGGFYAWEVWRGSLHTVKVPFNRYWHTKKNFENLIFKCVSLNAQPDLELIKPQTSLEEKIWVRKTLEKFGIKEDDKLICVNVNSGELALERRWPDKHFVKLINLILNDYNYRIVLIGTKSEWEYTEKIKGKIKNSMVYNLSGEFSFTGLVELLKLCKLLITNDSGPLHLAVALGIPTVSFFGPETPTLYGPLGNRHFVFFKNIDCSPCINVHTGKIVKCVKAYPECLESITPEEVFYVIKNKGLLE